MQPSKAFLESFRRKKLGGGEEEWGALEKTILDYRHEIATFLKRVAKEEREKAQAQFKFMEDL